MTKLDLVIERVKALPPEQRDMIVAEIEMMLDSGVGEADLSQAQEFELQRRLADPDRAYLSHEEVGAYFAAKYGR